MSSSCRCLLCCFSLFTCSSLPNAGFWEEFNSLVVDGILFIMAGFRKPARSARKGGLASMGKQTVDSAPLFGECKLCDEPPFQLALRAAVTMAAFYPSNE